MAKNKGTDEKKSDVKELSLKDQEAIIHEEIQRLIAVAKQKGEITIEEINEQLPAEVIAPEALDALMHGLDVNGVKISELSGNKDNEGEETSEFLADPGAEEEEEEEKAEAEDSKGND